METSVQTSFSSNGNVEEGNSLIDREVSLFSTEKKKLINRSTMNEVAYHTVRGLESFLIYTWLCKDLCWIIASPAWFVFSVIALCMSGLVLLKAIHEFSFEDVWHRIAELLWIFANFWWMSGDLHDYFYPDEPSIYDERLSDSAHVLEATMCWLGIFYFFIKPFDIKMGSGDKNKLL